MTTTDDFRALSRAWEGETVIELPVSGHVRRARQQYEHAVKAAASLTFGAWLNSVREGQETLETKATGLWLVAVGRSGIGRVPEKGVIA